MATLLQEGRYAGKEQMEPRDVGMRVYGSRERGVAEESRCVGDEGEKEWVKDRKEEVEEERR